MEAKPERPNKREAERIRIKSSKNIWNLSEGGAFIATKDTKRLGSRVQFELQLGPGGLQFSSLAKVIRVLHKPNPKLGEPAGMAVEFVEPDQKNRRRLAAYLSKVKRQDEKDG